MLGAAARRRAASPSRDRRGRDVYAALVRAIVGQQLSVHAARAIYGRLLERFDGHPPTPAQILADEPDELRVAVGLSHAKTAYLRSLAEHVLSGELELDRLQELSDDEVAAELTAVKGIGEWSAHIFLMFTLGRPDVLAVGDLGIRRAVQRAYGLEDLPAAGRAHRPRRAVAARTARRPACCCGTRWATRRRERTVDPPAAPRRARGAGRDRARRRGPLRDGRDARDRARRSRVGRRARAVSRRRARMGGGRCRRPPHRLPGQLRRRRLRARRAGQRRSRPRPPRGRSGARRPPRRRWPPPRARPRGDPHDVPRRAVERALLRAPGLHASSRPPTRAPSWPRSSPRRPSGSRATRRVWRCAGRSSAPSSVRVGGAARPTAHRGKGVSGGRAARRSATVAATRGEFGVYAENSPLVAE